MSLELIYRQTLMLMMCRGGYRAGKLHRLWRDFFCNARNHRSKAKTYVTSAYNTTVHVDSKKIWLSSKIQSSAWFYW